MSHMSQAYNIMAERTRPSKKYKTFPFMGPLGSATYACVSKPKLHNEAYKSPSYKISWDIPTGPAEYFVYRCKKAIKAVYPHANLDTARIPVCVSSHYKDEYTISAESITPPEVSGDIELWVPVTVEGRLCPFVDQGQYGINVLLTHVDFINGR